MPSRAPSDPKLVHNERSKVATLPSSTTVTAVREAGLVRPSAVSGTVRSEVRTIGNYIRGVRQMFIDQATRRHVGGLVDEQGNRWLNLFGPGGSRCKPTVVSTGLVLCQRGRESCAPRRSTVGGEYVLGLYQDLDGSTVESCTTSELSQFLACCLALPRRRVIV